MKLRFALVCSLVLLATMRGQPVPHYEQRIGEPLPLGTPLTDEEGRSRALDDFFHRRPIVLVFGYFRCAQLCSVVSDLAVEALRQIRLSDGTAFDYLYISIDPTDTPVAAASAKLRDLRHYAPERMTGSWHYLTGEGAAVQRLAQAAGFGYRYDAASTQYLHPSGMVIVTPSGVISRYFLGIDYSPSEIAAALRRAGEGKTGESVYDLVLTCFRGGAITGRYGPTIWRVLQLSVAATVLALGTGIAVMLRAERRCEADPDHSSSNKPVSEAP